MSRVIKATLDEDAYAFVKRQAEIAGRSESSIINRCVLLTLERSKEDGRASLRELNITRARLEVARDQYKNAVERLERSDITDEDRALTVRHREYARGRVERLEAQEQAIIEGTVGDLLAAGA